jgi:hypothetical protein
VQQRWTSDRCASGPILWRTQVVPRGTKTAKASLAFRLGLDQRPCQQQSAARVSGDGLLPGHSRSGYPLRQSASQRRQQSRLTGTGSRQTIETRQARPCGERTQLGRQRLLCRAIAEWSRAQG